MSKDKTSHKYNPTEIEPKWQQEWEKKGVYKPDIDKAKKPFYNLMMFPYPSAEGMHVGNMYAFTGSDVYGRFKRMQGFDVFEPIGLDGFGIHSENYALKIGRHPMEQAETSEKNFYRQLHATGNGFDWSRTVETYNPDYYKWTQWIFIQLFKAGLAYRKKAPVNFCPSCKTVLADEQVIKKETKEGTISVCERCSTKVEKKELEQWFFKITKYADRLLANLAKLDWSEKVKIAQREWIGRSEGVRFEFKIQSRFNRDKIEVFTTALDTVFGTTFIVLSPKHPLVSELDFKNNIEVLNYIRQSEAQLNQEEKEKTGVDTGYKAINPFTGEAVSVWIADYVLMEYGSGAIMGVPGHDVRDYDFAKRHKLPIKPVIKPTEQAKKEAKVKPDGFWEYTEIKTKFADESKLFDSAEFNGLSSREAKEKMIEFIKKEKIGKKEVHYHLRDWLISRQRYWGAPIPMIYCKQCAKTASPSQTWRSWESAGWHPVPEKDLPVKLPKIEDYKPLGTGKSPLANHPDFYEVNCPVCGAKARRETDVSDTFLDSAWYFFRYTSTDVENKVFDTERVEKWLPVTMYIGGAEHSVLHLLYSRFITMVFKDLGLTKFEEPYARFYAHGLLIKEGAKMSKSKGNVVIPDEYIKKYGADTLRTYLMFLGPFNQGGDFYDSGIEGIHKFLKRVWVLATKSCHPEFISGSTEMPKQVRHDIERMMHKTIKKVTEDLEALRYNTAIAALMEYYNVLSALYTKYEILDTIYCKTLVLLLAPFAPHMTEELYQRISNVKFQMSNFKSIHSHPWPVFDPKLLQEKEVTIVVQVNGKVRDSIKYKALSIKYKEQIEQKAKESGKIKKYLEGKMIVKVVYVQGKIINFVVND